MSGGNPLKRGLRRAVGAGNVLARAGGYELVPDDFYSPLPSLKRVGGSSWSTRRPATAIDLRIDASAEFLEQELAPYAREFDAFTGSFDPAAFGPAAPFPLDNGGYGSVDAETLYAMLRFGSPRRVLELGSGASSHVVDRARLRNQTDGKGFEHVIADPYPFGNPLGPVSAATVIREPAEDLDSTLVEDLQPGDVFFVDTTHTVKAGGDVVRIILDLLPRLTSGVLVHFHDVFTPYEYPRDWLVEHRRAWAEQYMLEAFLAYNDRFQVILPTNALARDRTAIVERSIPSFGGDAVPGAFWLKRL